MNGALRLYKFMCVAVCACAVYVVWPIVKQPDTRILPAMVLGGVLAIGFCTLYEALND